MTKEQLQAIAPVSDKAADTFLPYINKYQGDVNTPLRFAAFIANLLHESGCFKYVRELASGAAYEGRKDLGNIYEGDGVKFRGRGCIQITGRTNYTALSKEWYGDNTLVDNPDLLATPENAVRSAYWFWATKGLNKFADAGDFTTVVKRINGGLNGIAERTTYYKNALFVMQQP